MNLPAAVATFLDALSARDLYAVLACFTEDATYAYAVPMPPLMGRAAIGAMFGPLLSEASAVRWDIVHFTVAGERVWTERVDRFTFGDREVAIECAGVFELGGGRVRAVRDYVDLATWRERRSA